MRLPVFFGSKTSVADESVFARDFDSIESAREGRRGRAIDHDNVNMMLALSPEVFFVRSTPK